VSCSCLPFSSHLLFCEHGKDHWILKSIFKKVINQEREQFMENQKWNVELWTKKKFRHKLLCISTVNRLHLHPLLQIVNRFADIFLNIVSSRWESSNRIISPSNIVAIMQPSKMRSVSSMYCNDPVVKLKFKFQDHQFDCDLCKALTKSSSWWFLRYQFSSANTLCNEPLNVLLD